MEKRKRFALIALILVTIFCLASIILFNRIDASPKKSWNVKTASVERQDISSSVNCSGILEESIHRDIFAEQPLKVLKLYVQKGKRVKKGDRLLLYDTEQLRLQYEDLLTAVDIQEKTLEKIRNTASLSNGSYDPYAGYGTKELNLQEPAVASAAVLPTIQPDVEIQEKNLESAKRKLESVSALIKRIAESSKSPMDGIVSELNAAEGGYAAVQLPVIRLIRTDNLRVRAQVKEIDISSVKRGQVVEVTGDALGGRQPLNGKISEILPIAVRNRTATGTDTYVEAVVTLVEDTSVLIPGINVDCRIYTDEKRSVPVVDFMSVREDKNGSKGVYVVDSTGRIRLRPVKLGISSDMKVEVLEGLKDGEKVIINWQPGYKDGDNAKITGGAD